MGDLLAPKQDEGLLNKQRAALEQQKKKETLRKAEAESEVARRKVPAGGGRSLLIKTSPTGVQSDMLGG